MIETTAGLSLTDFPLTGLGKSLIPRLLDPASWPPLVTGASSRNLGIQFLPNAVHQRIILISVSARHPYYSLLLPVAGRGLKKFVRLRSRAFVNNCGSVENLAHFPAGLGKSMSKEEKEEEETGEV